MPGWILGALALTLMLLCLPLRPAVGQDLGSPPQSAQEAPLEEPEADRDLDDMLEVPPDDSKKVFSSDLEIELQNQDVQTLFELLEAAADADAARPIEHELLRRFHASGSETVDLLLKRVLVAINEKQNGVALDLVDAITILKPDFAEAWNKRATLHYAVGDLGKSIADLEKVLSLEPRHFGALNGLAVILQRLDRDEEALEVYDEVLRIQTILESAIKARDELRKKLQGRGA